MKEFKQLLCFIILLLGGHFLDAQIRFADRITDASYSGANPDFNNFYGNNGTDDGCDLFLVSPAVCLGDTDSIVALPTGSFITIEFTDNLVFDAPQQDDLFIEEIGGGQEFGELYVSPDGTNFTYLDMLNGAQLNSFDLADYPYDDFVKAIKIIGLDYGGCIPGLDISRVFGVEGANCPCGARLISFPADLCAADTTISLSALVMDSTQGYWSGPQVFSDSLNLAGLSSDFILYYILNSDHPICPIDSVAYPVQLANCDCNFVLNGTAEIDSCGICLDVDNPLFNQSCLDCAGVINGPSLVDSCGVCMDTLNMDFNMSCLDCQGVINGPAIIDLCGDCLPPDSPQFNGNCPEIYEIYLPSIFVVDEDGNGSFGMFYSDKNIAWLDYFEVYDRWGNLVFSLYNQALVDVESWWSGRVNNNLVSQGTYVYSYKLSFEEAEDIKGVGQVVLIN